MKKILLSSLQTSCRLFWSQVRKRIDFTRLGTHLHIALSAVIFILFLITTHKAQQVQENSAKIEVVRREIINYRDSIRILDLVKDKQIADIDEAVRQMQEVTVKNDQTVLKLQRDIDNLKLSQVEKLKKIDKATAAELVNLFNSKPIKRDAAPKK